MERRKGWRTDPGLCHLERTGRKDSVKGQPERYVLAPSVIE
jgi:hypothetical protein